MALTAKGIRYICHFLGLSNCCVASGLQWSTPSTGIETGGTAQVVQRLVWGLEMVTMLVPATGAFTKSMLDTANGAGASVTFDDAKELTYHDEPTDTGGTMLPVGQWCVSAPDVPTQSECESYGWYWYNGACYATAPTCTNLLNQPDCERYGCYWYNGTCHVGLPTCADLNNSGDCTRFGCYWWSEDGGITFTCHSNPLPECPYWNTQAKCEYNSCYWYNRACFTAAPTAGIIDNQPDCARFSFYWYGVPVSCHAMNQPNLCYWIDSKGGPAGLLIPDLYELGDSYIFNTPPTGFTFVPTVPHLYAMGDYYIGLDADAATGCNYY